MCANPIPSLRAATVDRMQLSQHERIFNSLREILKGEAIRQSWAQSLCHERYFATTRGLLHAMAHANASVRNDVKDWHLLILKEAT